MQTHHDDTADSIPYDPRYPLAILLLIVTTAFLEGCSPKGTVSYGSNVHRPSPGSVFKTDPLKPSSPDELLKDALESDVLYLGERHDNPYSHEVQYKILKRLNKKGRSLAIGLELFRQDQQSLLDRWIRGDLSMERFRTKLSGRGNRTVLIEYYRDIMIFARQNKIPLLALKPERKTVRQPRDESDSPDRSARPLTPQEMFLKQQFQSHPSTGGGFHDFVRVQQFWERGMAEKIHSYLKKTNEPRTVVVLTGNYHVIYDFGVPNKLDEFGGWTQLSVLTLPVDESLTKTLKLPAEINLDRVEPADYVWWIKPRQE